MKLLAMSRRKDRGDAMPFISHGIEHPVDALWGDDDFRFLVDFHEMA